MARSDKNLLLQAQVGLDEIGIRDSAKGAFKDFLARIRYSPEAYQNEDDILRLREDFNKNFPQLYREFRTKRYSGKVNTPEFAELLYRFLREKQKENLVRLKDLLTRNPGY